MTCFRCLWGEVVGRGRVVFSRYLVVSQRYLLGLKITCTVRQLPMLLVLAFRKGIRAQANWRPLLTHRDDGR